MKTLFAFFSPELDKGHEKGSSAADEADIVPLFSPVLEKIFDDDDAKRKPKGFDMSKLLESVIESEKWQMQSQGTTPRLYNHHVPACTHEKSENLVAASPATVDNKVAKGATVAKSGSFKETKVQSTPLDQGHAKQSRPVMESKKKSENINLRRKVDKKVVLAQGEAKGIRSPFVRPTLTPKDGKSIKSEKRQEQEKRSRHLVMECKKKSEGIESRGKQEKAVVVANRKIQRVVPVVRSSPTLICNDAKPIELEKHHQDRLDSLKAIKAVPNQELPNKVAGAVDLSNAHSVTKPKKDVQSLPTTAPATRSHKLSGAARIRRVSVQMPPFHHSRLYVQCGGLKPQMKSQGMTPRLYNHHVPACTHEKSENLVAASPGTVDNKVAKGATVAKSGSFKETKVQSTPLDQGHAKQSRPVMESKKKSENINLRRKVDKKVVLAQGEAKGIRSPFVRPTLTPKDGKSIKSEKRQEQEKRSRHLVMECKKKSEGIESRGKQEKAVVVANRKIQRVVPVVRSSPTLICNDAKPIESEKHHQDRLDSLKAIKAVPNQELPNKVAGAVDLSNAHSVTKPKKDVQSLPTTAPATRSHKLSGPARIRRVSVQMPPFHHSRLYVQCGGLKPQMQSQGMTPRLYNNHVPACTHEKSENLVAASPATVDHEVAKGARVAKSGSFKETKVQSSPLDQGHEKQSRPVMESKKKSENINSRRKVDKKVVLAQGDAKGVRSPFVRPTLTPKECKKKSEVIESRRKQEKAVVVTNRKIQRVVPVVRSSPTLIYKDVKQIESEKHHQGHEKQSNPVVKKSKRKPVPKPPVLTARKPPRRDSLAESRKTTSTLPGAASISTQRSHTAVAPRWK